MNFEQLLLILKSHLLLIIAALAITVATTIVVTGYIAKKYVASTSLILDYQNSNPFEPLGLPAQLSSSYMATQTDIISSRNVAVKVAVRMKLDTNTVLRDEYETKTEGRGSYKNWIAEYLISNLTVEPARESRVINISFESTDPKFSVLAADTFADAYIETTLELAMEPARRNAAWFEDQLKKLRSKLEAAEGNLTLYQQEKGIIAIDERLDTETRRLNELSSKLVTAQSDSFDVKSRQLGKNHPEYKRAIQRESSLRSLLGRQKNKVLKVKKQRDELSVLAREVENAQLSYNSTLQRYNKSSMESQFNQTNISILNKAVRPAKHSSPILILNIVIAVVLGLFLGIALAILIEMFNKKVRVEDDLLNVLGVPILAKI